MKKTFLLILFTLITTANAQIPLYRIESKAFGASFDLVVNEVKYENAKSYLKIKGFNTRTAPGTRWLFCIYTGLAMRRHFEFWSV